MNILYIHGLDSSLSQEKRFVLERYGNVQAPSIDYENNPNSIIWLFNQYKDAEIDVIIGSSMGGFAGYHLSKLLQVPSLLFNPALAYRSVFQNVPNTPETNHSTIHVIIGSKDETVDPKNTLNFLGDVLMLPQDYKLSIRHNLQHRIPAAVFEKEVSLFFKDLTTDAF